MRRIILLAVRLYPKAWRARYGGELDALLEDSKALGLRELADVMKGAVAMRMKDLNGWQLAAAFGTAGMTAMALAAIAIPTAYRSVGVFGVQVGKEEAAKAVNQAAAESLSPEAGFRQILDRNGLKALDLDEAKKRLVIRPITAPRGHVAETAVLVSFDSRDPATAQAVTRDYINQLIIRLTSTGVIAKAIGEPLFPEAPAWPHWRFMMFLGLLGGLILGGFAALLKKWVVLRAA